MEKIDTLLKTPKLELLKSLTDKIKGFSLKEAVEAVEVRLNSLTKTKKGLLGLSLIVIGGSLTFYSLNNAATTTKVYWQELKASKSPNLSNKSSSNLPLLKTVSPNGQLVSSETNGQLVSPGTQSNELTNTNVAWQPINHMLASRPERRAKALQKIGFPQSEGVIIALSLTCPECIKLALDINSSLSLSKDKLSSVVGVAVAPGAEIKTWKQKLNLDYEVKSISEADMEDLGVALLPTLIKDSNTSKNQQKPKYEITASSDDGRVLNSNSLNNASKSLNK